MSPIVYRNNRKSQVTISSYNLKLQSQVTIICQVRREKEIVYSRERERERETHTYRKTDIHRLRGNCIIKSEWRGQFVKGYLVKTLFYSRFSAHY